MKEILGYRLHEAAQPRLVASSGVFVNDAFASGPVDSRDRRL